MNTNIVIVGGGPVGRAFALAASRLANVDVTVVERSVTLAPAPAAAFDHRVYALSPASLVFLAEIGASPDAARLSKVRAMQVWGDDANSHLDLAQGQPIATIVEHAALMFALEQAASNIERIRVLRGAVPKAMGTNGNQHELEMDDGSTLRADLLVGADGSRSQIREWAGIPAVVKDYESDGIVANLHCEFAHGDVARQWFTTDAVLAYLPLPEKQISVVWSVLRAKSEALKALGDADFCRAVESAGHNVLGKLTLASPVARFPLARVIADHWCAPGLALMGDAAHAVHPLAGQGVNLGFADARTLCETLRNRSRFSAAGDMLVLRKYERARREATLALSELTDKLRALYMSNAKAASWVRNDGLSLLNRMPHAKAALVHYAFS
ncbi:MAG: FAD-dependent monooxygenase [Burkholderiales bacterium]|nr:FAD-dependent monooxygenase [Burkholderiales bacterium]